MNTRMNACLHCQQKACPGAFSAPRNGPPRRDVASGYDRLPPDHRLHLLTAREREVLRLLGGWKRKDEIASALWISPQTVEAHRARIREKLRIGPLLEFLRATVYGPMPESASPNSS